MFELIVIIVVVAIYLYYKRQKQTLQNSNEHHADNINDSEQRFVYKSVSDSSQSRNTNISENNVEIANTEIADDEIVHIQVQDYKINKKDEDNSELLTAVKEKINSQFIEPKKPEPLKLEISFEELNILHYCQRMFKKDSPYLPKHLSERIDIYNGLIDKGYFIQPSPDFFLKKKCKVDDLKEYLKSNNLTVSGNKDILIQRILDNINSDQLDNDFKISDYYVLSEKGTNTINKYPMSLVDRPELEIMLQAVYNHINQKILLDNLDFAAEDIKFLDNYKEYDLSIKAFTLVYDKIGSSELNRLTNSYFDSYSKIFEELYGVTIPYNVFMQVSKYLHSFKELKKCLKNTNILPTYKIQTMNDAKTCVSCKKINNKEFSYSDAKIGINYPPFYNCRSDFCRCYAETVFDESIFDD